MLRDTSVKSQQTWRQDRVIYRIFILALVFLVFARLDSTYAKPKSGVPTYTVFEPEMIGSNSGISSLSTDSMGRLIATSGSKLIIFDGNHWSSYTPKDNPQAEIPTIYTSITGPDNQLYCSSDQGLHIIEFHGNNQYYLKPIAPNHENSQLSDLNELDQCFVQGGYLYFYGERRIARYEIENEQLEIDSIKRVSALRLIPFRDAIIEYGTSPKVFRHKADGDNEMIPVLIEKVESQYMRTATIWNDALFLGNHTGIGRLASESVVRWESEIEDLKTNIVSDMASLSDDHLAVAVRSRGIYILNTSGEIVQAIDRNIDHRFGRARNFLHAGNGVLWASVDKSIVRIDFLNPLSNYSDPLEFAADFANLFFHQDTLHLATDGKLIAAVHYKGGGLKGYENLVPEWPNVIPTAVSTADGILFSDFEGIWLLKDDGTVQRISDQPGVNLLAKLKSDTSLIVACGDESFHLLEYTNSVWRDTIQSAPSQGRTYKALEMNDGSAWLEQGLGKITRVWCENRKLKVRAYGTEAGLPDTWIDIWKYQEKPYFGVNASGQIMEWDRQNERFIGSTKGILSEVVKVAGYTRPGVDSFGNLWVPTSTSTNVIISPIDSGKFSVDTQKLASLNGEFLTEAIPDENGVVWLNGSEKFFRYDPSLRKEDRTLQRPIIYQVERIDNHEILFDSRSNSSENPLIFPYSSNKIRIHLTSPNIAYTSPLQHRFLIEEYANRWSPTTGPNTITLTNLNEGDYTVKVRSTLNGEALSETASFSFVILPPLYRTSWAYGGYSLFCLVLFAAIYYGLNLRAERRNRELQSIVEERTKGLNNANAQLNEANTELMRMYQKAKDADNAKGAFLATVSHEMRTPLNAILGPSELLLADCAPSQSKLLTMIYNSGSQLLSFINDVLDFTADGKSKRPVVLDTFDLRSILEEQIEAISLKAKNKPIEIKKELSENLPSICRSDSKAINQIVGNLLSNALKFTKVGEIVIDANIAPYQNENSTQLIVSVSDTGVGIPTEYHESIFQPFKQVDDSYTREYEGVGLGLAICKQITNRLGGDISVESTAGEGTRFWFSIPIEILEECESPDTKSPKFDYGKFSQNVPKEILLADDNPSNREVATQILEKVGCNVVHATNGEEALEKAYKAQFNLILMDIRMPKMNGLEASHEIRKRKNPNQKTPIIALSAFLSESMKTKCDAVGIKAYLSKPITPDQLIHAVSAIN